jgi:hypothetical protein
MNFRVEKKVETISKVSGLIIRHYEGRSHLLDSFEENEENFLTKNVI